MNHDPAPDIRLVMPESTEALESQRGRAVMELFRKVARDKGTAFVVVTHDHRTLDVFDTIYEMEDGILSRSEKSA